MERGDEGEDREGYTLFDRKSLLPTDFVAKIYKLSTFPSFLFCLPDDLRKLLAQMTLYSAVRLPMYVD